MGGYKHYIPKVNIPLLTTIYRIGYKTFMPESERKIVFVDPDKQAVWVRVDETPTYQSLDEILEENFRHKLDLDHLLFLVEKGKKRGVPD